jgi:hypothetical protein
VNECDTAKVSVEGIVNLDQGPHLYNSFHRKVVKAVKMMAANFQNDAPKIFCRLAVRHDKSLRGAMNYGENENGG